MKFYYYETKEEVRLDMLDIFREDDGIHYCETGVRLSLDEDACSTGQGMILFSKEDADKFAKAVGKAFIIVERKDLKLWFTGRDSDMRGYIGGDYTEFKCGTICRRHYTIEDYTKFKGFVLERGYKDFYRRSKIYSCNKTLEDFKVFQQLNKQIYFNYEATKPVMLNLVKGVNGG